MHRVQEQKQYHRRDMEGIEGEGLSQPEAELPDPREEDAAVVDRLPEPAPKRGEGADHQHPHSQDRDHLLRHGVGDD